MSRAHKRSVVNCMLMGVVENYLVGREERDVIPPFKASPILVQHSTKDLVDKQDFPRGLIGQVRSR